jgi:hypothetical protein
MSAKTPPQQPHRSMCMHPATTRGTAAAEAVAQGGTQQFLANLPPLSACCCRYNSYLLLCCCLLQRRPPGPRCCVCPSSCGVAGAAQLAPSHALLSKLPASRSDSGNNASTGCFRKDCDESLHSAVGVAPLVSEPESTIAKRTGRVQAWNLQAL